MKRFVENCFYGVFVFSNSKLMGFYLFPGPFIKSLMTLLGNLPLIPRPRLHQEILLDRTLPKRVICSYQSKPALRLSNNVIPIYSAAKGASGPVIPHHVNVGSHQALIEHRAIPACGVKTALAWSEHVHIEMEVAEEVVACGSYPESGTGHGGRDHTFI